MAQDWYLLKSPHDQVSGYEDEAWDDFGQEGFSEVLETNMAIDVELCNYDLSDCKTIKAVVTNNLQDTKLKTFTRHLLVPVGTCKAGMYVKYKNRFWLIVGLVDDNTIYEKAVMTICNYKLSWINSEGKIISRWCNVSSASQYNNGETYGRFYYIRTDQLIVITPDDDDCVLIGTGDRFIIDRRCKVYEKQFSEDTICDTSNPVIVYKVTRSDSVLYDYQDSGHFEFMCLQDEQQEQDGYYIVGDQGYWLCKKPIETDDKTDVSSAYYCKIEGDFEIYNGLESSIFTAKLYNAVGKELSDFEPQWTINSDFADKLNCEYVGNSIMISVNDRKLINKSFELVLSTDVQGAESDKQIITIKSFI